MCAQNSTGSDIYVRQQEPQYKNFSEGQVDPNSPCDIVDLGIQRWVHVTIVFWNRTVDVYKNGKLARSCILDGVVPQLKSSTIKVGGADPNTSKNGHWGAISQVQYFNHALNAKQVYKRYRKGPDNWSLLNDFKNMFPKVTVSGNFMAYRY